MRLERLRGTIRDLITSTEYGGPQDVDLDWVADVHQVTRESDELFRLLTSMEIPEAQREQYAYRYEGMLQTIQITGYGSDRLLAAAVLVGPSGRFLLNMTGEESDDFEALVRESRFFLADAEGRINRWNDEAGQAVGGLGLRWERAFHGRAHRQHGPPHRHPGDPGPHHPVLRLHCLGGQRLRGRRR